MKTDLLSSGNCIITQSYEDHCKYGQWARGIDLVDTDENGAVLRDSNVLAMDAGTVIYAGDGDGYGNAVWIDHGHGIVTGYGHMNVLHVRSGYHVRKGDSLGLIGATGNVIPKGREGTHLHFECRMYKKPIKVGKTFWEKGCFMDTDTFDWYDPTSSVEPLPNTTCHYILKYKDVEIATCDTINEALDILRSIHIFDTTTGGVM